MNAIEVSHRSTDAWNRHDADALVALYAEEGTYHNPRLDHALTGQAIGDFAKSVWAAYPDMSLEIISRGTLEGAWSPFSGCYTEPTPVRLWTAPRLPGRTVAYPGASFTQVEGDNIRSEHAYVDWQTVAEQLVLKGK